MSSRIVKVNKLIKQEIGKLILHDIDFSVDMIVTVIKAETSADLRYTNVFISVFPVEKLREVMEILDDNIYFLQKSINKRLVMKPVPKIRFKEDKTGVNVEKIDKLINSINK